MTTDNQNSPSNPETDDGNIEACIESIADSLEILAAVAMAFAKAANLTIELPSETGDTT